MWNYEAEAFLRPIEEFFSLRKGVFPNLWKTNSPASVFLGLFSKDLLEEATSLSHQFPDIDFAPLLDFIKNPPSISSGRSHQLWQRDVNTRRKKDRDRVNSWEFLPFFLVLNQVLGWYPTSYVFPNTCRNLVTCFNIPPNFEFCKYTDWRQVRRSHSFHRNSKRNDQYSKYNLDWKVFVRHLHNFGKIATPQFRKRTYLPNE